MKKRTQNFLMMGIATFLVMAVSEYSYADCNAPECIKVQDISMALRGESDGLIDKLIELEGKGASGVEAEKLMDALKQIELSKARMNRAASGR